MMYNDDSVTTHLGYHSDTDLLQEALLACNFLNLLSESSQKSGFLLIRKMSHLFLPSFFCLSEVCWRPARLTSGIPSSFENG
jgi:hypothetical protein